MDNFASKLADQVTSSVSSQANESQRISEEQSVEISQTLINSSMVHVLARQSLPAPNHNASSVSSLCSTVSNSVCNTTNSIVENTASNTISNTSGNISRNTAGHSNGSFSTIVPANQQASKMTNANGLNADTDSPACRSSSTSSNDSELSPNTAKAFVATKPQEQSQPLSSVANPLSTFPFFNTFNLLHPILHKHLYAANGLGFSPFASAYLNQLQNARQLASPTGGLVNSSNNSSFVTNLASNHLTTNPNLLPTSSANSSTNATGNAPTTVNSSPVANPQHALRCKDEISSLVSGTTIDRNSATITPIHY